MLNKFVLTLMLILPVTSNAISRRVFLQGSFTASLKSILRAPFGNFGIRVSSNLTPIPTAEEAYGDLLRLDPYGMIAKVAPTAEKILSLQNHWDHWVKQSRAFSYQTSRILNRYRRKEVFFPNGADLKPSSYQAAFYSRLKIIEDDLAREHLIDVSYARRTTHLLTRTGNLINAVLEESDFKFDGLMLTDDFVYSYLMHLNGLSTDLALHVLDNLSAALSDEALRHLSIKDDQLFKRWRDQMILIGPERILPSRLLNFEFSERPLPVDWAEAEPASLAINGTVRYT